MSTIFEPKHVPSDIVARWPVMALSLWKRSFKQQAVILLAAALISKFFPAWATAFAFLIAPSLFIASFATVQIVDEHARFSWGTLVNQALPGIVRLGKISLLFAAGFGLVIAALASLSAALIPTTADAAAHATFADSMKAPPVMHVMPDQPQGVVAEFLHFCATWTEGVMAMVFLGMFIVAIYHGIFGAILHAQEGIDSRQSRIIGWQAWQVNSGSIHQAVQNAPSAFWVCVAIMIVAIACAFQTVYLSPVGLVLATYVPCLAYVAYRSIFHGKHENLPASARVEQEQTGALVPSFVRFVIRSRH